MFPSPRAQRIALRLSLALFTVAAALFAALTSGGAHAAPATPVATATFYGADTTRLVNAIQRVWPQASGPYCGLAAAEALVNYDDEAHGVPMRFTSLADQKTLAAANQRAGASMWATPRQRTPMPA